MLKNSKNQKFNLLDDILHDKIIKQKSRSSTLYCQHLYSALYNNKFQRLDVLEILSDNSWECSDRLAGNAIATMTQKGSYIDFYNSHFLVKDQLSFSEFQELNLDKQLKYLEQQAYVPPGVVTDEIESDLNRLGWAVKVRINE